VRRGTLAQRVARPAAARVQVTALDFVSDELLIATADTREGAQGGVRAFRVDVNGGDADDAAVVWQTSLDAATCIGRSSTRASRFWTGSLAPRSRIISLWDAGKRGACLQLLLNGGESDRRSNDDVNAIVESYCGLLPVSYAFLAFAIEKKLLNIGRYVAAVSEDCRSVVFDLRSPE
jgi:hypothetical protein